MPANLTRWAEYLSNDTTSLLHPCVGQWREHSRADNWCPPKSLTPAVLSLAGRVSPRGLMAGGNGDHNPNFPKNTLETTISSVSQRFQVGDFHPNDLPFEGRFQPCYERLDEIQAKFTKGPKLWLLDDEGGMLKVRFVTKTFVKWPANMPSPGFQYTKRDVPVSTELHENLLASPTEWAVVPIEVQLVTRGIPSDADFSVHPIPLQQQAAVLEGALVYVTFNVSHHGFSTGKGSPKEHTFSARPINVWVLEAGPGAAAFDLPVYADPFQAAAAVATADGNTAPPAAHPGNVASLITPPEASTSAAAGSVSRPGVTVGMSDSHGKKRALDDTGVMEEHDSDGDVAALETGEQDVHNVSSLQEKVTARVSGRVSKKAKV